MGVTVRDRMNKRFARMCNTVTPIFAISYIGKIFCIHVCAKLFFLIRGIYFLVLQVLQVLQFAKLLQFGKLLVRFVRARKREMYAPCHNAAYPLCYRVFAARALDKPPVVQPRQQRHGIKAALIAKPHEH